MSCKARRRQKLKHVPSLRLKLAVAVTITMEQYVEDDDIPATQQSVNELQAQVTALVAAVAALNTQNTAPALRNRRGTRPHNQDGSEEEDDGDENPFAPLQRTQQNRNNNNDSDSDDDATNNSWKSSFKIEIPEFKGSTIPEELMDWFVTVEEILEFKEIPLDRCVPFIAIRFHDRAAAWWKLVSKSYRKKPLIDPRTGLEEP
uniref:Retrotransposon gag domain-containing protein n=1 Tax=Brassica oleracea var. oleracea TaxID=109376 RepID=A0A0D3AXX5_BRAOL